MLNSLLKELKEEFLNTIYQNDTVITGESLADFFNFFNPAVHSVIITDIQMPIGETGISEQYYVLKENETKKTVINAGLEIVKYIKKNYPDIVVIGHSSDYDTYSQFSESELFDAFIPKEKLKELLNPLYKQFFGEDFFEKIKATTRMKLSSFDSTASDSF